MLVDVGSWLGFEDDYKAAVMGFLEADLLCLCWIVSIRLVWRPNTSSIHQRRGLCLSLVMEIRFVSLFGLFRASHTFFFSTLNWTSTACIFHHDGNGSSQIVPTMG